MVVKSTLPTAAEVEALIEAQSQRFKEYCQAHYTLMAIWAQWLKVLRAGDAITCYVHPETVYAQIPEEPPGSEMERQDN